MCLHNSALYEYLYSHFETSSIRLFLQSHKIEFTIYNILQTLDFSFKNKNSWEIKLFEVHKYTTT